LDALLVGSHLDSVPNGGRFDGALGVVAAIAAVGGMATTKRDITLVCFRDEEGSRFGNGLFGSRALCGRLSAQELAATDSEGVSRTVALERLGYGPPSIGGWLGEIAPVAFVEAHIEQGPILHGRDSALGVVTDVVGIRGLRATFTGAARHAGTTPILSRRDALCAASALVLEVRRLAEREPDCIATVGNLSVHPNATNVVADRVELTVDLRAVSESGLAKLHASISAAAEAAAEAHRCGLQLVEGLQQAPVRMSPVVREGLAGAAPAGEPAIEMVSGAGHDAAVLALAGVPAGLLFVRSQAEGASHCPEESTTTSDVGACIKALRSALTRLADRAKY
jgi:allantoate deiminase